jgi:hypothetical protein
MPKAERKSVRMLSGAKCLMYVVKGGWKTGRDQRISEANFTLTSAG